MTPEEMQDRDIVEFTDDSGNTLMLEVMDYFYYNGQEFAALCDAQENPSDDEPDDDPVYIMQVNTFEDENGEEMEEFVPPEEALMEKLIQIVRTRFTDDEDEDDEEQAPVYARGEASRRPAFSFDVGVSPQTLPRT